MKPPARVLLFPVLLVAGVLRAQSPAAGPAPVELPALVAEITAHHPELQFYEAEVAAARAGVRSAAALADPEVSLELGHKRVRESTGAPAGEGTAWAVAVTQTFEWPGRIALRKAIANRQAELAELGIARFRHAHASRARTLAYGLVGIAETTSRLWVAEDLDHDPDILARQVADLAWAGLRGIHRIEQ